MKSKTGFVMALCMLALAGNLTACTLFDGIKTGDNGQAAGTETETRETLTASGNGATDDTSQAGGKADASDAANATQKADSAKATDSAESANAGGTSNGHDATDLLN